MRLQFHNGSSIPAYHPGLSLGYLGDDTSDQQQEQSKAQSIGQGIIGGAFAGAQVAIATGSKVAGGIEGGLLLAASLDPEPISKAFLFAAAGLVGPIAMMFKGCGTTCTQATQIANDAEVALTRVRDLYLAQPIHYASSQRGALAAYDHIAEAMYAACNNPALGAAGQRCISERLVRGGTAPWCPTSTGCDWITTIRDPIANDPDVVPDPPAPGSADGGGGLVAGSPSAIMSSTVAGIPVPLLLGGAVLMIALSQSS